MSRKTWVQAVIALAILLAFAAGAWWIWMSGAPMPDRKTSFHLDQVQGQVEIQKGGVGDWQRVDSGVLVQKGDVLRTGEGSSVEIHWDERGWTRLDAGTQLAIEDAPSDPSASLRIQTALRVDAGRAWSRLLKLLDVDSSFAVRTDAVVATVRGTTFGVTRKGGAARVDVAQSVVNVQSAHDAGASALLRDRQSGDFAENGSATSVTDIATDDAWVRDNQSRDDQDDHAFRAEIDQRFAALRNRAPEWVMEMSERARLMAAKPDELSDLTAAFLARRLAVAQIDPTHARQILGGLDMGVLRGAALERAIRDVRDILFMNVGRVPSNAAWIETLRSLRASLLTQASGTDAYARALVIDDAIDDALFPSSPLSDDDRRARVVDLNGQVSAWERAYGTTDALRHKADAMRDRLTAFGIAGVVTAPNITQLPQQAVTSTEPTVSSTIDVVPVIRPTSGTNGTGGTSASGGSNPQQTTSTRPTASTPSSQSCDAPTLALLPSPASTHVGQSVSLQLYATCPDGSVQDLTSRATFQLGDPTFGQINGSTFVPSKSGAAMVRGLVLVANAYRGSSAVIEIAKTVKSLTAVRAVALGSTSLTTGQSSPLDATAIYSDGSTTDIKYQCVWSTSDPRLAMVSNGTFQSLSGTGSVTAQCAYTENGISKTGSVTFTVALDPSLTPTTGSGSNPTGPAATYNPNPFTYVP